MSPRVHRLCQPAPLRVPSTHLQTQRPCPAASRSPHRAPPTSTLTLHLPPQRRSQRQVREAGNTYKQGRGPLRLSFASPARC